ncbi:MAG TPA: beta-propeller fold lactonase family protein [Rhodocyclaceae bacterium]|nr:beta-propeller fold lactonase family protein [Rhodocyclaceae bacterium]
MRKTAVVLAACAVTSAWAGQGVAYVSNQKGNILTIDLSTFEPTGEIEIGGGSPRGLGITGDGKLLAVAVREKGDLAIVDVERRQVTSRVPIGKNPEFVRVRGDRAFVTFEPASEGGPPPKPGSIEERDLAAKRKADGQERARIAVVDLKRGRVERQIEGGMETEGIEFSRDGKRIMVTNEADDNITIHDLGTGKLLNTIDTRPYGHRPRGIKLSPSGQTLVVTIEHGNKLLVFDSDFNIVRAVPTGDFPYGVSFDRAGQRILVATAKGKTLQVFDAQNLAVLAEHPIGDRCWHFTFAPDDRHVLLACGRSNEVLVLQDDGRLLKRIPDALMPWGIVVYPKAFGSLDAP